MESVISLTRKKIDNAIFMSQVSRFIFRKDKALGCRCFHVMREEL